MEKKNAKVTGTKPYGNPDNYGNHSYIIEFDNGDSGFFRTKQENQGIFKLDEFADYTIETKTKKSGDGTYSIIKKPNEYTNKPGFTKGVDKDTQLQIVRQSSLKIAFDFLAQGGYESQVKKECLDELISVSEYITNYVVKDK